MSTSDPRRRTPPNKPTPESSPLLPTTQSTPSPLLPTSSELLALVIVPTILLIGSLYSYLDPSIRSAPYDASIHAIRQHAHHLPSYFASKNNVFNVFFVKVGWAWLGVAVGVWTLRVHNLSVKSVGAQASRIASQVVLRYVALTVLWILVVRWIPVAGDGGLIDLVFRWSGGVCSRVLEKDAEMGMRETHIVNRAPGSPVDADSPLVEQGLEDLSLKLSAAACRAAGGSWGGGHDISGHVFLMGCAMTMLALEMLPWFSGGSRAVMEDDGAVKVRSVGAKTAEPYSWEFVFVGAVYALFGWMILMTAVFFHTWPEKTTGFILSFTSVYLVYFVPRAVSTLRNFLGVPGL